MIKINSLGLKFIAVAIIGFSVIGCGSGGGGDSSTSDNTTTSSTSTEIGTFVDSPVQGLKYETATLSGYTDESGQFKYKKGETVTFKIGNLNLGSVKGNKLITPLTLAGENDLDNISNKATNIARVLQSLDDVPSNDGLIRIPSSLKNLQVSNIDLESDADLNTILAKAEDITAKDYILKDSVIAKSNMKKYISLYNQYNILDAGYYSGTKTTYYLLSIPKEGNIIFSANWLDWGSGIMYLFDTDLNEINYFDDDNAIEKDESVKLLEGSYIIKVDYPTKGGTITVNSNSLLDQNTLPIISAGTYSGIGVKYYLLIMPSDGNIVMDGVYYSYLYDTNLNPINYYDNDNKIEVGKSVNLTAGSYILKVNYGDSMNDFTVTSNLLK